MESSYRVPGTNQIYAGQELRMQCCESLDQKLTVTPIIFSLLSARGFLTEFLYLGGIIFPTQSQTLVCSFHLYNEGLGLFDDCPSCFLLTVNISGLMPAKFSLMFC